MKILALDTSNKALSVAILEDGQLLAEQCLTEMKNHSVTLMPVIAELVEQVGWAPKDLERIVVAHGPGSYTGLRMAVATAKVLASTLGIDLVGVSSLYALVPAECSGLVVPLIDARRNSVYVGFYANGRAVYPDKYAAFETVLEELSTLSPEKFSFVGEVSAFEEQIRSVFPEATITETLPSAYQVGLLGQTLPAQEVVTFEPQYLKRVEAEENWLKTHTETQTDYIKRV